jgi:hypothetical protein
MPKENRFLKAMGRIALIIVFIGPVFYMLFFVDTGNIYTSFLLQQGFPIFFTCLFTGIVFDRLAICLNLYDSSQLDLYERIK